MGRIARVRLKLRSCTAVSGMLVPPFVRVIPDRLMRAGSNGVSKTMVIAGTVAVIAALGLASSAVAGQPVNQSLSPPPPPWLTCKAVGTGTICDGTAGK